MNNKDNDLSAAKLFFCGIICVVIALIHLVSGAAQKRSYDSIVKKCTEIVKATVEDCETSSLNLGNIRGFPQVKKHRATLTAEEQQSDKVLHFKTSRWSTHRYIKGETVTVKFDPDKKSRFVVEEDKDRSYLYSLGKGAVFLIIGIPSLIVGCRKMKNL